MTGRPRRGPRGGKGGADPRARVRLRELQVMAHLLEGQSQDQIAAQVGISQPAVSKIVRRLDVPVHARHERLQPEVENHAAAVALYFMY